MVNTKNAQIKDTFLGKEDHGIPTCYLRLDFGGSQQSFGGHDLRFEDYGIEYLMRILEVVGVRSWEDLPGKYIRVVGTSSGITKIGHITEDRWFNPKEDLCQE